MTLVLRIALPVIYLSFFGMFIITVFLVESNFLLLSEPLFRAGLIATYVLFALIIWFTLLRLRRVEFAQDHFFVSNYFKNYRYHKEGVQSIKEINLGICTIVKLSLLEKGSWGKHLYFLAKKENFITFKKKEPTLNYR